MTESSPATSYAPGATVAGKYRLERRLGVGGMAEVWAALNTTLDLPVALKLIHRNARRPELLDRLLREAQAAAKLLHPGVVRVFDFGATDGGEAYIVMERLEGQDLRELLMKRGRLPPEEAVRLMLPVAAGLHAAHLRGVVHRDLKPDNVLLARDHAGRVHPKILDFGIAKLTWLETDGEVVGTPEYMAPEQAFEPADADHRADVWGFCSVLYELIAGAPPLPSTGMLDAMRAALQDPVPSLVEAGLADVGLWAIIERGLHKDPQARWSSMERLGASLAQWLAARGVREDISGTSLDAEWSASPTLVGPDAELPDAVTSLDAPPLSIPGRRTRRLAGWLTAVGAVALVFAYSRLPDRTSDAAAAAASSSSDRAARSSAVLAAASSSPVKEAEPPPAAAASAAVEPATPATAAPKPSTRPTATSAPVAPARPARKAPSAAPPRKAPAALPPSTEPDAPEPWVPSGDDASPAASPPADAPTPAAPPAADPPAELPTASE